MNHVIGGIDYGKIAEVADKHGVEFTTLCKRAEEDGARTVDELLNRAGGGTSLRQPSKNWVTTRAAAERVGMSYQGFVASLMSSEIECYGIKHRSRSRLRPTGKRGCGVLYWTKDLDEVARIRQAIGGSTRTALRVFQAMRRGLL